MQKVAQAIAYMQQRQHLADIKRVAPRQVDRLIETALQCKDPGDHWTSYERLKGQGACLAGWDSPHKELRSNGHYEAMTAFIDWLLELAEKPDSEDQEVA